jgi:two-component system phosphate regulon response regulator PhoB
MPNLPIIFLSSKAEEQDQIIGFTLGADDYITKPFSPRESLARIRAVMRRVQASDEDVLVYGDIEMDLARHKVQRGGQEIHLGPTEYRLLRHFLESPGRVFSREQLLDAVWGRDVYVEARTVDVHIRRLRKTLNHNDRHDIIRTVRSAGYAIDTSAAKTV